MRPLWCSPRWVKEALPYILDKMNHDPVGVARFIDHLINKREHCLSKGHPIYRLDVDKTLSGTYRRVCCDECGAVLRVQFVSLTALSLV